MLEMGEYRGQSSLADLELRADGGKLAHSLQKVVVSVGWVSSREELSEVFLREDGLHYLDIAGVGETAGGDLLHLLVGDGAAAGPQPLHLRADGFTGGGEAGG